MNPSIFLRRRFLKAAASFGGMALAAGAGLLAPVRAFAAWNKAAFDAKAVPALLQQLGAGTPIESADILIKAPEIAENGAVVPIEVFSKLPGTTSISVLVEKNPSPLISTFRFASGAEGFVSTRIKMGETSPVRAVVEAGGKFYTAAKEVKVTLGGCGG
jgi:sulfur-oxidizing protein SoxY